MPISRPIPKAIPIRTSTVRCARSTVIGYTQRGNAPTARDSSFAFEAGCMAVQLLKNGVDNQVIGVRKGRTFHMPIDKALAEKRRFNKRLFSLVNTL